MGKVVQLLLNGLLLLNATVSRAESSSLVGAVGIETNTDRNFKDLEEMLGSAKELKRNNGECKGIFMAP